MQALHGSSASVATLALNYTWPHWPSYRSVQFGLAFGGSDAERLNTTVRVFTCGRFCSGVRSMMSSCGPKRLRVSITSSHARSRRSSFECATYLHTFLSFWVLVVVSYSTAGQHRSLGLVPVARCNCATGGICAPLGCTADCLTRRPVRERIEIATACTGADAVGMGPARPLPPRAQPVHCVQGVCISQIATISTHAISGGDEHTNLETSIRCRHSSAWLKSSLCDRFAHDMTQH